MAFFDTHLVARSGSDNAGPGPSGGLWSDLPRDILDPNVGYADGDNFLDFITVAAGSVANYGTYTGFASTGGAASDNSEQGGVVQLYSDGDNEGANIARAMFPFKITRGLGKLWFEARIKTSTITDAKHNLFVGLAESLTQSATVPITSTGTLADQNLVGFFRSEAASHGAELDFCYKANGVTAVTLVASAATLAAATYVKVGFKFDPVTYALDVYVNGAKTVTGYSIPSSAGTDFPNDVFLGFIAGVINATGTSPGTSAIDWWYAAQKWSVS